MTHPICDLPDNAPDELVPDPQVAREFNVTLMTLWRWDRDPRLAEFGWEPPVKIRRRNYRRRGTLEKFKAALRNFGITALRGAPQLTGAQPPRGDGQRE
jgi:hypothetical protein